MTTTDSLSVSSHALAAPPALPDHGAPSRFWESIRGEEDLAVTEITGTLPPGLTGTLYRNGSGRWNIGPSQVKSLFDVDGMVSAFILDGTGVHFRNRFVRTKHYLETTKAGAMVKRGFVFQRPGGLWSNIGRQPANTANTSVMLEADSLLALHEGGRPHRLDLDTLNTIGACSLGGALQGPTGAYSAHYTYDPIKQSYVNFGIDPIYPRIDPAWVRMAPNGAERVRRIRELAGEAIPRLRLRLYETDKYGQTHYVRSVPLPGLTRIPLIHDMALTSRYAIFTVSPYRIDSRALFGGVSMWDSMKVKEGEPTYLLLAPRDGGKVRVIETDPFYSWHYTNAFEDGPDVVVELARLSLAAMPGMKRWGADTRLDMKTIYDGMTNTERDDAVRITRLRISASGHVTEDMVTDLACEFPQFDQRRSTQHHNITYVAAQSADDTQGAGIARIDHRTGDTQKYCPPGNALVEPTFIPRSADAAEGDGWVLTVGYEEASHRSRLMIFDAAHIDAGPTAEAWLPFHVPMSFHGVFTDRIAKH